MIAYVQGRLVGRGTEAVVEIGREGGGGVGLTLLLSARAAESLPAVGDEVRLWTHLAVREDAWTIYGFPALEERAMFRLLISVSGVGPKVALGVLSGAGPAELARCLSTGDEKALTRLPGIGKKSAARLVVELGQKIPDVLPGGTVVGGPSSSPSAEAGLVGEALAVLTAMGLAPAQAEGALAQARRKDESIGDDLEKWVRAALANL